MRLCCSRLTFSPSGGTRQLGSPTLFASRPLDLPLAGSHCSRRAPLRWRVPRRLAIVLGSLIPLLRSPSRHSSDPRREGLAQAYRRTQRKTFHSRTASSQSETRQPCVSLEESERRSHHSPVSQCSQLTVVDAPDPPQTGGKDDLGSAAAADFVESARIGRKLTDCCRSGLSAGSDALQPVISQVEQGRPDCANNTTGACNKLALGSLNAATECSWFHPPRLTARARCLCRRARMGGCPYSVR